MIREHGRKANDEKLKKDLKVESQRLQRKIREDIREKIIKPKALPQTEAEKMSSEPRGNWRLRSRELPDGSILLLLK